MSSTATPYSTRGDFNPKPPLSTAGVTVPGGIKPPEVMNEFGIVLSGPIIKNKLFLFGNYGQYRYQQGANPFGHDDSDIVDVGSMTHNGTMLRLRGLHEDMLQPTAAAHI